MDLQKKMPDLILTAKEEVDAAGLGGRRAQVAGVLDISGSTRRLYSSGLMKAVTARGLALGFQFDDNGELDMFTFGIDPHDVGRISQANVETFIADNVDLNRLEGGTMYAPVMWMVAAKFFPNNVKKGGVFSSRKMTVVPLSQPITEPVYVLFVTDGESQDSENARKAIVELSQLPIFWQFVGLGDGNGFGFLQSLDTMPGRVIDNAGFFAVNDIASIDDSELFRRMLAEFPGYIPLAQQHGMII